MFISFWTITEPINHRRSSDVCPNDRVFICTLLQPELPGSIWWSAGSRCSRKNKFDGVYSVAPANSKRLFETISKLTTKIRNLSSGLKRLTKSWRLLLDFVNELWFHDTSVVCQ